MSRLRYLPLIVAAGLACATPALADSAASLREKYASLGEALGHNQFGRPLVLDSVETPSRVRGDIYALVAYPMATVTDGLNNPAHWCDMLLLHINTKYCHPVAGLSGSSLRVNIGTKTPQDLADSSRVELNFNVAAASPDYVAVVLSAKDGPLGSSDYLIELQAVALPDAKTFLHLAYSYSLSFAGQLVMKSYLGTVASDKVGFTVRDKQTNGQPDYIGGMRGLMERNTMRYFLAIDSFLEFSGAAPQTQLEQRLQSWFSAVERYPRQLHEVDREQYLEMKRAEYLRQQVLQ